MANTWVIDLRHYLTPAGTLAELPGRAGVSRNIGRRSSRKDRILISRQLCGVTAGRGIAPARECLISVSPDFSGIMWCCPVRGDNGVIRGWQGTFWDNGDTPEFSR
jgi:hypothetical protein